MEDKEREGPVCEHGEDKDLGVCYGYWPAAEVWIGPICSLSYKNG